jgi:type IV secretory pathway TrbF-like protein
MRIRAKEVFNSPAGEAQTGFTRVIGQYDDYVNKLINDIRVWRVIGLLAVVLITATVVGWFYFTTRIKETVLVVEVNELGRARYIGDVTKNQSYLRGYVVKDYMTESVLRDFICFTREVNLDSDFMAASMQKASKFCSREMQQKLSGDLQAADPFAQVGRSKLIVEIESSIKTTNNTWQYDWYDVQYDLYGRELNRQRYRGLFTVVIKEAETDLERFDNPLGIYIVDYNITKLNEVLR